MNGAKASDRLLWRVAGFLAVAVACACGGPRPPSAPRTSVALGAGRPSLLVVERDGDARAALAVAVVTEGIAPARGAAVALALSALLEHRLAARGIGDTEVAGSLDGWRLRALVASPSEAARLIGSIREAMFSPVAPNDPALGAVARRIAALARRPLPDRALWRVARCTGEAFAMGDTAMPTAVELETWRQLAHGLGRVAIATAGEAPVADAVAQALARAPAWPKAAPLASTSWPAAEAHAVLYDASGEIQPGGARIVLTAHTASAERAAAAAPLLGDAHGPLASRLAALEVRGHVRSVVAAAHADGGCIAITIDLSAHDLGSDAAARIALVAALARQEVAVQLANVVGPSDLGHALATRAWDPRDAAERAAWWGLSASRDEAKDDASVDLVVGLAEPRDTSQSAGAEGGGTGVLPALADVIRVQIDRAEAAANAPVIEARTRVERGQGEAWVLLASPCGTLPEGSRDAGSGAAVAVAAAMQARARGDEARVEPFVAADGIGVLAHGPARPGESPQAHARRLGDLAARAFAADALDSDHVSHARTALLARVDDLEERALAAASEALAPGHPSWVDALGTTQGLGSVSDDAIAARAAAIRAGPLRVAVLANIDSAQADAAVQAVDRWVARRPGLPRTCPPAPTLAAAHPGTYALEPAPAGPSEALLAIPLPPVDESARVAATWIAAALDGPGGLLARAVGGPVQGELPNVVLARAWSASVLGIPRAPALVVRIVAADSLLDAAVAQARVLLDRLRQGALREEDRTRAAAALARSSLAASLDPRARTIDLWRSRIPGGTPGTAAPSPSLEALRAFAATTLRDDALIIASLRPPRGEIERTGPESRGSP